MRRSIPLIPFILFISFILFIKTTSAQKLNSDLYLQTSELAHLMINYEADRNSNGGPNNEGMTTIALSGGADY